MQIDSEELINFLITARQSYAKQARNVPVVCSDDQKEYDYLVNQAKSCDALIHDIQQGSSVHITY